MVDFLRMMLVEPFEDGGVGFIIGCFMWAIFLAIIGLVLYGCVWLVDNVNQTRQIGVATVVERTYYPAHTTITYISTGEASIPTTQYHPESFGVTLTLNEKSDDVSINEGFFNVVQKNDKYNVVFVEGRLTGDLYIKEINNKVE